MVHNKITHDDSADNLADEGNPQIHGCLLWICILGTKSTLNC